jgi:hypothetical protein
VGLEVETERVTVSMVQLTVLGLSIRVQSLGFGVEGLGTQSLSLTVNIVGLAWFLGSESRIQRVLV